MSDKHERQQRLEADRERRAQMREPMSDLDKADLMFIAILADHIRQRPGSWSMTDDEAVTEARAIYEAHLGERADPVVTMKMISAARGR